MKEVVLLFVVATAVCASVQRRCCICRKFSGLTMRIQATLPAGAKDPIIGDVYTLIDYDADLKMERTVGHQLDPRTGTRNNYTEYRDFNQLKKYTVTASGCKVEHLNEVMIPPCVAANFTILQQYTLGSSHAHSLSVTAWEGTYLGTLWMNIHFIDDTCDLLSINIYGPTPDRASQLLYTYMFANMKQGQLSGDDVFTLPESCNHDIQTLG